jgi:hypothetical protein
MIIYPMRILLISIMMLFGVGVYTPNAFAVDEEPVSAQQSKTTGQEKTPVPENSDPPIETLEKALSKIGLQKESIAKLQKQVGQADWIINIAIEARLDRAWMALLKKNIAFVEAVVAEESAGTAVENYHEQVIETLNSQPDVATAAVKRIRTRIEIPGPELSAVELAAAYSKVFTLLESLNQVYELFIQSLELSKNFDIDVTRHEILLKESLSEMAANRSILLELAMVDVTALRAAVSVVPDDAEVNAKLAVTTNHVVDIAEGLAGVLIFMESLEMDTVEYREQVLSATGQITTDVFEVGVINKLLLGWGKSSGALLPKTVRTWC